jgi:hypothetical protein
MTDDRIFTTIAEFRAAATQLQRVQTHPATDAWMQGDRYGLVTFVGRKWVHVNMDASQRTRRFHPSNLILIG